MFNKRKKYNQLPDRDLVDLFKAKSDMNALGVLFQRYTHLVAAIAVSILKDEQKAKDVCQEIFEVVVKDLKKHDVQNFNAWLHSVTKFHCFKVKKIDLNIESREEFETSDDFDEILERELLLVKRVKILRNSMENIKPQQQKCIDLFYLQGNSYNEVAEITDLTVKEVKSHIQNGKRNLKILMTKDA